jgi:hypothetical protein
MPIGTWYTAASPISVCTVSMEVTDVSRSMEAFEFSARHAEDRTGCDHRD